MEPSGLILLPYLASAVRSDLCDLYAVSPVVGDTANVSAGGYAGTGCILVAHDAEILSWIQGKHGARCLEWIGIGAELALIAKSVAIVI